MAAADDRLWGGAMAPTLRRAGFEKVGQERSYLLDP